MINKKLTLTIRLSYPDGTELESNEYVAEFFEQYIRHEFLSPEEAECVQDLTVVIEDLPDESPN